jgi:ATP-dependent Clp protease ATP-binding subunit ClpC
VGDPGRPPFRAGIRFSRRAKKILELALRETRHLRHDHIGSEHILLALIREGEGMAAQILATKESLPGWRELVLAELDNAA